MEAPTARRCPMSALSFGARSVCTPARSPPSRPLPDSSASPSSSWRSPPGRRSATPPGAVVPRPCRRSTRRHARRGRCLGNGGTRRSSTGRDPRAAPTSSALHSRLRAWSPLRRQRGRQLRLAEPLGELRPRPSRAWSSRCCPRSWLTQRRSRELPLTPPAACVTVRRPRASRACRRPARSAPRDQTSAAAAKPAPLTARTRRWSTPGAGARATGRGGRQTKSQ